MLADKVSRCADAHEGKQYIESDNSSRRGCDNEHQPFHCADSLFCQRFDKDAGVDDNTKSERLSASTKNDLKDDVGETTV